MVGSCGQKDSKTNETKDMESAILDSSGIRLAFENTIFSIPSPQQTSIILKSNNIELNRELPNDPANAERYFSTLKLALNIGIYGVDMGYLNMYRQTDEVSEYYSAIIKLANQLEIIDALDKDMLERVKNNTENNDSILNILVDSYSRIDTYLRENNRELAGLLILTGGWIESVYLATQKMIDDPKPDLIEHIEYQKYPLEKIIKLLSPYYNQNGDLTLLVDELTDLAYEFDCIDVEFSTDSIINDTLTNTTYINNELKIVHNNYNLNKLASLIVQIRTKIVQ